MITWKFFFYWGIIMIVVGIIIAFIINPGALVLSGWGLLYLLFSGIAKELE